MDNTEKYELNQLEKDLIHTNIKIAMEDQANARVEGETYYYDKKRLVEETIELLTPCNSILDVVTDHVKAEIWDNDLEEYFND